MSRLTALFASLFALIVVGCVSHPDIVAEKTTSYPDGRVEWAKTSVRAPKYAEEGTSLSWTTNGFYAFVSSSQDAGKIEGAIADGASKKIVYGGLALIMLLGAVALALPNYMVSNKDALMIIGCGGACFVVFRYVEASASYIGILIPIVAVAGGAYLFWQWRKSKKEES